MDSLRKNKNGKSGPISVKWVNGSVSSLVVIAGIFCIAFGVSLNNGSLIALGALFVILGLGAAVLITAIIKGVLK